MIRHLLRLVWSRRRSNLLVMMEVFCAFLVTFAVTTMGLQAWTNYGRPLGFDWHDVFDVEIERPRADDNAETVATLERILLGLHDVPEVLAAGTANPGPYTQSRRTNAYERGNRRIEFREATVGDGLAEALHIQVIRGRWFGPEDDGVGYEPMVINRSLARDLFGDGDPIGGDMSEDAAADGTPRPPRRVVGVIDDFRQDGELMAAGHYAFVRSELDAADPHSRPASHLLLRMTPGADALVEEQLAHRLSALAPGWSLRIRPLAELREETNAFALAPIAVVSLIASFLMLMVFLGLSGVMWQSVSSRTREIGLRRAQGASAADIRRQVLLEIGLLTSMAVVAGVGLVLQVRLLGWVTVVPTTVYLGSLAGACGAIYVLTLACGLYPGHLATRLTPAEALRDE